MSNALKLTISYKCLISLFILVPHSSTQTVFLWSGKQTLKSIIMVNWVWPNPAGYICTESREIISWVCVSIYLQCVFKQTVLISTYKCKCKYEWSWVCVYVLFCHSAFHCVPTIPVMPSVWVLWVLLNKQTCSLWQPVGPWFIFTSLAERSDLFYSSTGFSLSVLNRRLPIDISGCSVHCIYNNIL